MDTKVILMLNDGMRPDYIKDHKFTKYMMEHGSYSLKAQTVWPSMTLPCHMSLFHSVDPQRHGITTNTYTPPVRPIWGLAEVLTWNCIKSSMFFDWEELRDLTRPENLTRSEYVSGPAYGREKSCEILFNDACKQFDEGDIEFTFLYFNWPDFAGHEKGWGSPEYQEVLQKTCDKYYEIVTKYSKDYRIIVTADHGGHDRTHGALTPEDMTIPIFMLGKEFEPGREIQDLSIKDIAPTICDIFRINPDPQWEGKSVVNRR